MNRLHRANVALILFACLIPLVLAGCQGKPKAPSTPPASPPAPTSGTQTPTLNAQGNLVVHFFDIGQGDSALIQFPNGKTMLIDAGPPGAQNVLIPELKKLNIQKLDYIVASHPHNDHIGGFPKLLTEIPTAVALDSGFTPEKDTSKGAGPQERYLQALDQTGAKFVVVKPGQSFHPSPDTTVTVLAPRKILRGTDSDPNNNSVILRVDYDQVRLLFTGDMEEDERETLYSSNADLKANVLKVAHHGSHNGTDDAFLNRVKPQIAIISCEKSNDYGHPHKPALDALAREGATLYRTDLQGTITLISDGKKIEVRTSGEKAAANPSAPAFQGAVIGNSESKIYHAPDCTQLPAKERQVTFKSAQEAINQGYRPHQKCIGGK